MKLTEKLKTATHRLSAMFLFILILFCMTGCSSVFSQLLAFPQLPTFPQTTPSPRTTTPSQTTPPPQVATIEPAAQQGENLDKVIRNAARRIEETLPMGTKVAVLNFASPSVAFSGYVIEELTGELVHGRKLTIVDRSNLELISREMNLQLSGDVSDESAQAIGRLLGAQSIISGNLTDMGTFYRFRIRVISVETAAIQTQVSLNLQNDAQATFLLTGSYPPAPPVITASPTTSPPATTAPGTASPPGAPTQVIAVANASQWNNALVQIRNGGNNQSYTITVNGNITVPGSRVNSFGDVSGFNVIINALNNGRLILSSQGSILQVALEQTIVMNGVSLMGSDNNTSLLVINGGSVTLSAGSISDNTNYSGSGGGVRVFGNGVFIMQGNAEVRRNFASGGGGVSVEQDSTFIMQGSSQVHHNSTINGGGVRLSDGTFTMRENAMVHSNGDGNRNPTSGVVVNGGTFTMQDSSSICGNRGSSAGGVFITGGTFFMQDNASIYSNVAPGWGAGISIVNSGSLLISGGTVYGNGTGEMANASSSNRNLGTVLNIRSDSRSIPPVYGTGSTWTNIPMDGSFTELSTYSYRNNTIRVVNGQIQP